MHPAWEHMLCAPRY